MISTYSMLLGEEWSMEKVNKGELTPMFFGSAMTNFGVRGFLEEYLRLAPTTTATYEL